MKANRVIWGFVALVVLVTIIISSGSFGAVGQSIGKPAKAPTPTPASVDTRDLTGYGIVNYETATVTEPTEWAKRSQVNSRYDKQDWVLKSVRPETGGINKITESPPPPLFPVEESSIVVVGTVVAVQAHLSNDKTGIYSEFTVRVDEVLNDKAFESQPTILTVEREGGVVLYPNGQRVRYVNSDRALPLLNSSYIFFLTKDQINPNYDILAAYELHGNRVRQMETGNSFKEFKDTTKAAFIGLVRRKLSRASH